MNINFGYLRVLTKEQNLDRQYDSIKRYITDEKYNYCDKARGRDIER
ncbi:recombinase family protein [Bacillus toyonensis]